jgi:hypothetical protein
MRIRPLTRREIQQIRARNVRDNQRYEEWREERRRRRFRPKIPRGPTHFCRNCGTSTKQRTVYAKLPLSGGRQVWEEVFMICIKCFKEGRNPVIHLTREVYSLLPGTNGVVQSRAAALVLSILKDGPLPFRRVVRRLWKAGVRGLAYDIEEKLLKPMVGAGLISSEEVDYTQRVMEKVLNSRMRLKACTKDKFGLLLPIYIQFREAEGAMRVRIKRLGFFCLNCRSLTFDDELGVRRLLKIDTGGAYAFNFESQSTEHRRRRRKSWDSIMPVL